MPVELPLWQSITFGTTAWRISMGRRQVVESANSALKGAFADLGRGFFRVMASRSPRTTWTASGRSRQSRGWETTARRSKSPSGSALGVAQGR
jgi:hypothetical protein